MIKALYLSQNKLQTSLLLRVIYQHWHTIHTLFPQRRIFFAFLDCSLF